jgi:hypothetical protein
LVALAVFVAACGGDNDKDGGGSGGGGNPITGPTQPPPPPPPTVAPLVAVSETGQLGDGLDLQYDTNRERRDWVTRQDGYLCVYPSGQLWGFVGVIVPPGGPIGSRKSLDLSAYKTLEVDMKGAAGNEEVSVGIKDSTDPDNGTEVKKTERLTTEWKTYRYDLATTFTTADLKRVYLLIELVFDGANGRTVSFRNVRYVP